MINIYFIFRMEQINPYDPFSRRTPSAVPPQMGIPPQLGKTFMPEKNSAISCIQISISRGKKPTIIAVLGKKTCEIR